MRNASPFEAASRTFLQVFRATVNKVDDNRMMQETSVDMQHSHKRDKIEAPQNYGFSSTVMPRDGKSGQGGGYDKDDKGGEAAEAVMMSAGGFSHYVAVVMDDRRHRPRKLPAGASIQYGPNGEGDEDVGHTASYVKPGAGIFLLTALKDGIASLRHVEKPKQQRPPKQQEGKQEQQEEDYPHEGKTVNTEVRCTKGRIEFLDGADVVGYYDREAKEWLFKSGDNFVRLNGSAVTINHAARIDTVGPTHLGLGAEGEDGDKVATEAGLALKTWAKV